MSVNFSYLHNVKLRLLLYVELLLTYTNYQPITNNYLQTIYVSFRNDIS